MRTNLAPVPTQQWQCIGLEKWHQSIARREASRIASQTCGIVLQWTIVELDSTHEPASVPEQPPHIVLISRKQLEDWVTHPISSRSLPKNLQPTRLFASSLNDRPVHLLWDWGFSGKSSLEWATSLGFAGVIFDFLTLRSWARVAAERLPSTLKELHPLVATLPTNISFKPQKS